MTGNTPEKSPIEALGADLGALARRAFGADGIVGLTRLSGGATQEPRSKIMKGACSPVSWMP